MKELLVLDLDFNGGYMEGAEGWYQNDRGDRYHFVNGYIESINDMPAIIEVDGSKVWVKKGKRHRDNNKPAIEKHDGAKYWMVDGQRHREDGPAIEDNVCSQYWVNGMFMKKEDFLNWQIKHQIENSKHPLQELPSSSNKKKLKV